MSYTIEPGYDHTGEPNGFAVYEHGTYPASSVLAGQSRRVFLARYKTLEEARADYPRADVLDYSTKQYRGETLEEISGLPSTPPDWFDSANAGETW